MNFFKTMSPTTKSKLISAVGVLALFSFFILLATLSEVQETIPEENTNKVNILVTQDPRALGMDAVTAKTLMLEKVQHQLQQENARLRSELTDIKQKTLTNHRVQLDLQKLAARDEDIQAELKKNTQTLNTFFERFNNDVLTRNPQSSQENKSKKEQELFNEIVRDNVKRKQTASITNNQFSYGVSESTSVGYEGADTQNNDKLVETDTRKSDLFMLIESEQEAAISATPQPEEPQIYLPQGAILTGVMLTGMDAPTTASAQETPYPSLVRIKKEAILPNYQTLQEVRECFALLGGYGDLSSERVMFRGEGISCVREDGSVIETKFSAYAVGEDAKAGLRGRLVSRNSKALVNAMLSGFASGLASAFDVDPVPVIATESNSQQQYQEVFSSSAVQGGVAKGASNAMEKLADYYMQLADATHPVIEISGGRMVNIVVTKGTVM